LTFAAHGEVTMAILWDIKAIVIARDRIWKERLGVQPVPEPYCGTSVWNVVVSVEWRLDDQEYVKSTFGLGQLRQILGSAYMVNCKSNFSICQIVESDIRRNAIEGYPVILRLI
jgi:hypothetical protein